MEHPRTKPALFGQIALELGFLSQEELEEVLKYQQKLQSLGYSEFFGDICLKLGYLTKSQVDQIIQYQRNTTPTPSLTYGQIGLQNGFFTPQQLQECIELQKKSPTYAPIGHYLLKKNYITPENHQAILKALSRASSPSLPPKTVQLTKTSPSELNQLYGRVALEYGMVTPQQLDEFFYKKAPDAQKFKKLEDYLLAKNYITTGDHHFIIKTIEKRKISEKYTQRQNELKNIHYGKGWGKQLTVQWIQEQLSLGETKTSKSKTNLTEAEIHSRLLFLKIKQMFSPNVFRIVAPLSQGGTAVVYRAIYRQTGQEVAIKILPSYEVSKDVLPRDMLQDQAREKRFQREKLILQKIHHPNIVQILDAGEVQDFSYYVMELLEGLTLDRIIWKAKYLEERYALEITLSIALALEHIWKLSVFHRDVKPDNILILPNGNIKLLDFGLAKHHPPTSKKQITPENLILGTPSYMAPEQSGLLKNFDPDIRSDIYSLGITLFYMLAGHPPYSHPSPLSLMMMHLEEEIPSIRQKRPEISHQTESILQKMLAKHPDYRYQTPSELINDLKKALAFFLKERTQSP
ncbi:MAG: serine/threonine protein kinase [Planctomycetota bacterium]|nr:MAG: serine/threonine protein kinase [Planctomycetota bacterium]